MALHIARRRRLAAQQVRDAVAAARARWSAAVLIVLAGALLGGLVGAGAGQWVGWRAAGPLPDDFEAAAIARLALGGSAPAPLRHEELFGYDDRGAYGPGYVRFAVEADAHAAAFERQAEDMRVRLATAGWRVDPARPPARSFVADKDAWRVRLVVDGDRVNLDLVRREPVWVLPGGALGGLFGAAVGWLLATLAVRRAPRLRPRRRRVVMWSAVAGGAAALLPVGYLAMQQLGGHLQYTRPQIPLWTVLAGPLAWPAAFAAVALAAAVVLTLIRPEAGQ